MQNPTIPVVNASLHLTKGEPPDPNDDRETKKMKIGDEEMEDVPTEGTSQITKRTFKDTLV